MHDKGLSTNIDWRNKDAYGNSLGSRQREKMQRLRKWNERFRTRDSKERNLKQALGEIDRMASALGLPTNVRETASVIYRRALDEDLLPGRSIEGVSTACVYAAARQAGVPGASMRSRTSPASRKTRSPAPTATWSANWASRSNPPTPRATSPLRLGTRALRRGRAPRALAAPERQRKGRSLGQVAGRPRGRRGVRRRAPDKREDHPGSRERRRRHLRSDDSKPVPRAPRGRGDHRDGLTRATTRAELAETTPFCCSRSH